MLIFKINQSIIIMKKKSTLLTSLLFILFVSTSTFAQLSSQKIDALMEDALTKFKVAGASIAVVKDGKIIHQKGYGVTSVATKKRLMKIPIFRLHQTVKPSQQLHLLF